MNARNNNLIKNIVTLVTPFLLFVILFIPYNWINQEFIVKWFGCGCPTVDEFGNMIQSEFNANTFTALFWMVISFVATVISMIVSKHILKEKKWLRLLYIIGVFLISLLIAYQFCQMMMWN